MRRAARAGRGITALFAGDSGTGKTMAAEVIAGELGLDLYAIDLATVVDKYIGETEKNLDRIFGEADRVQRGAASSTRRTRSSASAPRCSDAHDRYANVEVAYLLQRMERSTASRSWPRTCAPTSTRRSRAGSTRSSTSRCPTRSTARGSGSVILAPSAAARPTTSISSSWPRAFELSGGNIRNIALAAAFLAAAEDAPVAHGRPDPRPRSASTASSAGSWASRSSARTIGSMVG